MELTPNLLFCELFLVDETPVGKNHDSWAPVGGSVSWQINSLRRKPPMHLLFCKCPRFQIINVLKWHIWGWHIPLWKCLHFYWGGGYLAYGFLKICQTVHLRFLHYFVKLYAYNVPYVVYKMCSSKPFCSLCCFVSLLQEALLGIQSYHHLTVLLLQLYWFGGSAYLCSPVFSIFIDLCQSGFPNNVAHMFNLLPKECLLTQKLIEKCITWKKERNIFW